MAMNVLVFPCGSEIGLEIHRALTGKKGINLVGLSSVDDHGRYVYENLNYCPMIDDANFIDHLKWQAKVYNIDVIYPANDVALLKLKQHEHELCRVVGPSLETVEACNSKLHTYTVLAGVVNVPSLIYSPTKYPVFIKPNVGHSGIGCYKINNEEEMLALYDPLEHIAIEYLPGREYTIDCFADKYAEGRER
jgi:predicted ATP-grasp superfamily ATP-dependent carboligase